jgi:hypothetical protein
MSHWLRGVGGISPDQGVEFHSAPTGGSANAGAVAGAARSPLPEVVAPARSIPSYKPVFLEGDEAPVSPPTAGTVLASEARELFYSWAGDYDTMVGPAEWWSSMNEVKPIGHASTGAALGTTGGRALGTKAQTERDYIQSLRMNLISDIKAASNKSAQELNSNMELRAALDSLSDPYGQSFETALRTIAKLSRDYGKGEMAIIEPAPAGAGAAEAGAGGNTRRYDSTGKRIQ